MRLIFVLTLVAFAYVCSASTPYFFSTVRMNNAQQPFVSGASGTPKVQLLWSIFTDKGNIIGSPAILTNGSLVYATTNGFLYHVDTNSHLIWKLWLGSLSATPQVDANGNIYIGSVDSNLYVVTGSGMLKWKFTTGAGIVGNVLITNDGRVVLPSRDGSLYFLNQQTGAMLFNYTFGAGNEVRGTPAMLRDGTIVCGSLGGVFVAIDSYYNTRWTFNAHAPIASTPLVTDTLIVFTTRQNGVNPGTIFALSMGGQMQWYQNTTSGSLDTQPILSPNGQILVGGADGKMYSLQINGIPQWRFMSGAPNSAPTVCGDSIVFASSNKYVYGLNYDGIFLWKYPLMRGGTAAPVCTSLSSNSSTTIYVGSLAQTLYAINSNY